MKSTSVNFMVTLSKYSSNWLMNAKIQILISWLSDVRFSWNQLYLVHKYDSKQLIIIPRKPVFWSHAWIVICQGSTILVFLASKCGNFKLTVEKLKSDSKWLYQTYLLWKYHISAENLPRGSYRIEPKKFLSANKKVKCTSWFSTEGVVQDRTKRLLSANKKS